jgi:hypothetical protein
VRLEGAYDTVTYFKITSKKTGKFFIYEVGGPSSSRVINLAPGEYTVEVKKEEMRLGYGMPGGPGTMPGRPGGMPRMLPPQTFIVTEEPFMEIQGQKVHAVLKY